MVAAVEEIVEEENGNGNDSEEIKKLHGEVGQLSIQLEEIKALISNKSAGR